MSVCNGEQFIESTLEGVIARIKDINAIHILDGAWENSGYSEINSTDRTEAIIQMIDDKYGEDVRIIYEKSDHIFRNPSEKRNYQLELIDNTFEEPYTIFWIDDDEEIRFRSGIEEIWIKEVCKMLTRPAIIDTYAYNSNDKMLTGRLIPSGQGIHWHSEQAMCLHDNNCEVIINWTPKQNAFSGQLLALNELYIVNRWNRRNQETLQKREAFNLHEKKELEKMLPCMVKRV